MPNPHDLDLAPDLDAEAPADAEYHAALEAWEAEHPSGTPARRRLLEEIVRYALDARHAFRRELARREELARRARDCWDDDRHAEAEALAAKLSRAPALTAARLRRTRHGALLMIGRWEGLATALEQEGDWTPAQQRMALDLLGTPREFRDLRCRLAPTDAGPAEVLAFRRELARAEVAALEVALADGLEAIDEAERETAAAGLALETCPIWRRARREEERDRKRLERAWSQYFGRPTTAPATAQSPAAPAPQLAPARPATPPAPAPARREPRTAPTPAPSPLPPAPARPAPSENRQARRARRAQERRRSA